MNRTYLLSVFLFMIFYQAMGQENNTLEALKHKRRQAKAEGDFKALVEISKDMGDAAINADKYNEAGIYYEQAINYAMDHDYYQNAYNIGMNVGESNMMRSNWAEAENFYASAVEAAEIIRNKMQLANALLNYGIALRQNNKAPKAIDYLLELKKIVEFELSSKKLKRNTYVQLREAYKQTGNQEKYLRYLELSKVNDLQNEKQEAENKARQYQEKASDQENIIKDQSTQIRNIKDSLRIVNLLRKEQEYKSKIQQQKIKNQELELKNERTLRRSLIIGLVVITLFAILWFVQFRQKKKVNTQLWAKNKQITQQKEYIEEQANELAYTNRELEKLSIVASETSNAVAIITPNFELEWTNPSFVSIHGYSEEEIKNRYGQVIQEDDTLFRLEKFKTCRDYKQVVQFEARHSNGEDYWTQVTLTPILDENNKIRKLISVESDISEIKSLEEFKDKLTRMIVHDLKNPLNTIMGISELMEPSDHVDYIKLASNQMLNMVENILDVQKFENNQMQLDVSTYEVDDMVNEAVDEVRLILEASRDNKVKLSKYVPEDLQAAFDYDNMKRVLVNLLTNAIKYTPDGGAISIKAKEIIKQNQENILVSIKDTGYGIPADMQDKIFNQFTQVNAQNSGNSKSTGIGLTFCKLMVEAHGGEIGVESEVDQGSEFYFYIPSSS